MHFYVSTRPDWQVEALCYLPVHSCVRPPVYFFVYYQTVNKVFWKRMNRFWCKLAKMVLEAKPWNYKLCGSGCQRSKLHEAKDIFRGMAEASFWTPLGRVEAFLIYSEYKNVFLKSKPYNAKSKIQSILHNIYYTMHLCTVYIWRS